MAATALKAGFQDSIHDSQSVFKAVMTAMSRPGQIKTLDVDLDIPAVINEASAATLLALADHETPLWLSDGLLSNEELTTWLKFHTGASITDNRSDATFALVSDINALDTFGFSTGIQEYPDRSVTYIIEVESLSNDADCETSVFLQGPGINPELANGHALTIGGVSQAFWDIVQENYGLFPCGADFIFTCGNRVAALPRSTRVIVK